jgi:hypothetical protein
MNKEHQQGKFCLHYLTQIAVVLFVTERFG